MRGTLRGVRTRVERLVTNAQRRSDEPDWEHLVARLQQRRGTAQSRESTADGDCPWLTEANTQTSKKLGKQLDQRTRVSGR